MYRAESIVCELVLYVIAAVVHGVHVVSTALTRVFREETIHWWRSSEQRRKDGGCVLWQMCHSKGEADMTPLSPF